MRQFSSGPTKQAGSSQKKQQQNEEHARFPPSEIAPNKVVMIDNLTDINRPHLRHPKLIGRPLPDAFRKYRRHIPILMHGKRVTFSRLVSEKNEIKTPTVNFPNVVSIFLYSRLLDLNVLTKCSTHAMRKVEEAGGLDEYMLTTSTSKIGEDGSISRMYQTKIMQAWRDRGRGVKNAEIASLGEQYGGAYQEKLEHIVSLFEKVRITKGI